MIKQIIIPVAAFAITVTGASAFNSDMLSKIDVDLTSSQISALEEAQELMKSGDREGAQALMSDLGIEKPEGRGHGGGKGVGGEMRGERGGPNAE